jgi:hypothetical protein
MFFPSLRVDVVISLIPAGETIPDERAKHAMLLVDAIEERADMAILAGSDIGKRQGIGGGFHLITFTQRGPYTLRPPLATCPRRRPALPASR